MCYSVVMVNVEHILFIPIIELDVFLGLPGNLIESWQMRHVHHIFHALLLLVLLI